MHGTSCHKTDDTFAVLTQSQPPLQLGRVVGERRMIEMAAQDPAQVAPKRRSLAIETVIDPRPFAAGAQQPGVFENGQMLGDLILWQLQGIHHFTNADVLIGLQKKMGEAQTRLLPQRLAEFGNGRHFVCLYAIIGIQYIKRIAERKPFFARVAPIKMQFHIVGKENRSDRFMRSGQYRRE